MVSVFGYYSAPTRAAGQGKWNFFRWVGVCFGLPLPDFLGFLQAHTHAHTHTLCTRTRTPHVPRTHAPRTRYTQAHARTHAHGTET
jgi:hypothetical protein